MAKMHAVPAPRTHFHARPDSRPWDTLVVAERGRTQAALSALKSYGRFRWTGYPAVLVGERDERCLSEERLCALEGLVQRVFVGEQCVDFEGDNVTETLCVALEPEAARLCGRSYYVRTHLRGMKGRLETQAIERALGSFLFERAASVGEPARVSFKDADVVVGIEVVGARIVWAMLDRETRALPFVAIR
ncbi:MAG: tRNA(Ser,Leu) C12 N-acetylase TAN1 [Hyphomicrobiaceae bacterium]|jgi:tRNA(Ser,Leu) C12 N-acetylase TAN1